MHKTTMLAAAALTVLAGCTTVPETPPSTSATPRSAPNSTTVTISSVDSFCETLKTTAENVSETIAEDNGNTAKVGEQFTVLSQTAAELGEPEISEGLYSLSNALLTPQTPGSEGEQNLWGEADTNMQQADKRLRKLCGFTVYNTLN